MSCWTRIDSHTFVMEVPNGMVIMRPESMAFVPGEKVKITEFVQAKQKEYQVEVDKYEEARLTRERLLREAEHEPVPARKGKKWRKWLK